MSSYKFYIYYVFITIMLILLRSYADLDRVNKNILLQVSLKQDVFY